MHHLIIVMIDHLDVPVINKVIIQIIVIFVKFGASQVRWCLALFILTENLLLVLFVFHILSSLFLMAAILLNGRQCVRELNTRNQRLDEVVKSVLTSCWKATSGLSIIKPGYCRITDTTVSNMIFTTRLIIVTDILVKVSIKLFCQFTLLKFFLATGSLGINESVVV